MDYYKYMSQQNMNADKKDKALDLLDQIIEHVKSEDFEYKRSMIKQHKGSNAVGEGWTLFHLKILKELIENGNV